MSSEMRHVSFVFFIFFLFLKYWFLGYGQRLAEVTKIVEQPLPKRWRSHVNTMKFFFLETRFKNSEQIQNAKIWKI